MYRYGSMSICPRCRLRCYIASLQGTELPNPQTLLASISKPTKLALGKVGVFSVASLHAIVSRPVALLLDLWNWFDWLLELD